MECCNGETKEEGFVKKCCISVYLSIVASKICSFTPQEEAQGAPRIELL